MNNPSVIEFLFFFFGFGILPTFVLCKVGILFYLTYKEKKSFYFIYYKSLGIKVHSKWQNFL